jgi:hypothetical protein
MDTDHPRLSPGKVDAAWVFAILAWSWLLFFLPDFTGVGIGLDVFLMLATSLLCLGVLWIAVTAFVFLPTASASRATVSWWVTANSPFVLAFVLVGTDVGLISRVHMSEPWLEERVAQVQRGDANALEGSNVGLFRIERACEYHGVTYFFTSGHGLFDACGIAFVPDGREISGRFRLIRHLFGPWYTFWWKF